MWRIMFEIREFVENQYSAPLGGKLRSKRAALKIKSRLESRGRVIVITPLWIYKLNLNN